MDTDIAPALYEKISDEISKKIKNSTDIQRIYRLIDEGKADYKAVNELAEKLGGLYSAALKNNLTAGVLPDGKLYYNIAERTVRPALESCYGKSAEASVAVQQLLNKAGGIGVKAIQPQPDNERVSGIIDKLSNTENIADVSWVLDEPVINFAQSAVTDTIKTNAEFQSKSGLSPKIVRTVTGKCCKWCEALAGTYTYPGEVPKDVYRRHERCRCIVEYLAGNGMKQNVHSKKWTSPSEQAKIEERKHINPNQQFIKNAPKNGDNKSVREWYVREAETISQRIDKNLPLEQQARQAFEERNRLRTTARNFMNDTDTRRDIEKRYPNRTFEDLLEDKMKRKGLTRQEALEDILKTSTTTNESVNKKLEIGGKKK